MNGINDWSKCSKRNLHNIFDSWFLMSSGDEKWFITPNDQESQKGRLVGWVLDYGKVYCRLLLKKKTKSGVMGIFIL